MHDHFSQCECIHAAGWIMAPAKLFGLLLLLFVCITFVHSGKSKKTIKIHVPYYVKHIHHYKKVYVPKVQVVKHEHLHKKEHEHHHHHDHGHSHHHGYDKSSDGGYHDDYDSYYDDIDHRSFKDAGNRLPKSRQRTQFARNNYQSSEELRSSEEDDDYIAGPEDEGTLPAPLPGRYRPRPTVAQKFQRSFKRADVPPTDTTQVFITPAVKNLIKRIVANEAS